MKVSLILFFLLGCLASLQAEDQILEELRETAEGVVETNKLLRSIDEVARKTQASLVEQQEALKVIATVEVFLSKLSLDLEAKSKLTVAALLNISNQGADNARRTELELRELARLQEGTKLLLLHLEAKMDAYQRHVLLSARGIDKSIDDLSKLITRAVLPQLNGLKCSFDRLETSQINVEVELKSLAGIKDLGEEYNRKLDVLEQQLKQLNQTQEVRLEGLIGAVKYLQPLNTWKVEGALRELIISQKRIELDLEQCSRQSEHPHQGHYEESKAPSYGVEVPEPQYSHLKPQPQHQLQHQPHHQPQHQHQPHHQPQYQSQHQPGPQPEDQSQDQHEHPSHNQPEHHSQHQPQQPHDQHHDQHHDQSHYQPKPKQVDLVQLWSIKEPPKQGEQPEYQRVSSYAQSPDPKNSHSKQHHNSGAQPVSWPQSLPWESASQHQSGSWETWRPAPVYGPTSKPRRKPCPKAKHSPAPSYGPPPAPQQSYKPEEPHKPEPYNPQSHHEHSYQPHELIPESYKPESHQEHSYNPHGHLPESPKSHSHQEHSYQPHGLIPESYKPHQEHSYNPHEHVPEPHKPHSNQKHSYEGHDRAQSHQEQIYKPQPVQPGDPFRIWSGVESLPHGF